MIPSTTPALRDLLALGRAPAQRLLEAGCVFIFRLRPVMMLSSTLMPLNSARFWNVRATPISATWREFMCWKVWPRRLIEPCCGW